MDLFKQLWGIQIKGKQFWRTNEFGIVNETWVQNPQSIEFVDLNIIEQLNFFLFKRNINSEDIYNKKFELPQFCKRSRFQSNLYTSPTTNQDTVVEVVHCCQFCQISHSKKKGTPSYFITVIKVLSWNAKYYPILFNNIKIKKYEWWKLLNIKYFDKLNTIIKFFMIPCHWSTWELIPKHTTSNNHLVIFL